MLSPYKVKTNTKLNLALCQRCGGKRLYVGKNATLKILGRFDIDFDSNIEIFDNAELIIHGSKLGFSDANAGFKVICGERIEIMSDVGIGRNVMIRDTNGQHFMNTTGYRPQDLLLLVRKFGYVNLLLLCLV